MCTRVIHAHQQPRGNGVCELNLRQAWQYITDMESIIHHYCRSNGQIDEDCLQFVRLRLFELFRTELTSSESHPLYHHIDRPREE